MQPIRQFAKRNELAIATHHFEQNMQKVDFGRFWDLRDILNGLPHIHFRDGYTLDGCYVGDRSNASFKLYAYKIDSTDNYIPGKVGVHLNPDDDLLFRGAFRRMMGKIKGEEETIPDPIPFKDGQVISGTISHAAFKTVPPLSDYLDIDFDEKTIWEAMLLLEEISNYLPHRWHGGYANGRLIVDGPSLVQSANGHISNKEWGPFVNDERIHPKVELVSEDTAFVHYCCWGNWSGLTYVILKATRKGRSVTFEEEKTERLIEYDCGMRF